MTTQDHDVEAIPNGWVPTSIGQVAETIRGVTYKKEESSLDATSGLTPILRATNIGNELDFEELAYVPQKNISADQFLRVNDIVIAASSGSRAIVGKAAILSIEWRGSFGAFCYVLRPSPLINATLLGHFLRTSEYRNQVSRMSAGVNINNLRREHIESISYRLAPITEQARITDKIDEQFSRLDAAVVALKRVQANLKRYRAAVLKAACEGRLVPTEAELARREGRSYEPASVLLERLLADPRKQKRPLLRPDMTDAPVLPEGWAYASLDQVTSQITSGSRDWSRFYDRGSSVFLMAQNVRPGKLDLSFRQLVDPPKDDPSRTRSQVQAQDLLVTIVGANTGNVCRIPVELPEHYVCQSVALVRPTSPETSVFLDLYLNSQEHGVRQFARYIYGAGRPHLRFDQLMMTCVVIPPLPEQSRIAAEVARRMSIFDEIESQLQLTLLRADGLRQSILKSAFQGKLVPQDPNDEPACVLLERIRTERDAKSATSSTTKRAQKVARL